MALLNIILLLIFFSSPIMIAGKRESNIKLVTVVKCKQPKYKYDPESPILTEISIKKVSRGFSKLNITYNVTKTFGPIELHARSYQVKENAERNLMNKLEHMDCKSFLAMKIVGLANLQFDKHCNLKMGIYGAKNFDINNLRFALGKTFTSSGRYSYDLEFYHKQRAASCITVICDVTV